MPKYHSLDTAIRLCVWDPKPSSSLSVSHSTRHDSPASGENDRSTFKAVSLAPPLRPNELLHKNKPVPSADPANGHVVTELSEEYFKGHEGIDFLDHAMPFFLVNTGREIFKTASLHSMASGSESGHHTNNGHREATRDVSSASQASSDSHASSCSTLSSISSSIFTPEVDSAETQKADLMEITESTAVIGVQTRRSSAEHAKATNSDLFQSIPNMSPLPALAPMLTPKPIKVVVELSRKSFMPSLYNSQRQDLCVNIFFNGEFTTSRILNPDRIMAQIDHGGEERFQHYSGRRVDTNLEVPWVLVPPSQLADGSLRHTKIRNVGSGSLDRWVSINQMILAEADKWGRYGRHRSPMGEYLEGLSKRTMPEEMMNNQNGTGSRVGIIDVVIALGKTAAINGCSQVPREPHRKLHENICGKRNKFIVVPEELRPKRRAQLIADFSADMDRDDADADNDRNASTIYERSLGAGLIGMSTLFKEGPSASISEQPCNPKDTNTSSSVPWAVVEQRKQNELEATVRRAGAIMRSSAEAEEALNPSLVAAGACKHNTEFILESDSSAIITQDAGQRTSTATGQQFPRSMIESMPTDSMPPPILPRRASLPSMLISSSPVGMKGMDGMVSATMLMTPAGEQPLHLSRPKATPQKRYRGLGPDPVSEPSPKRQKAANPLEVLPFDLDKSASLSTRSRRAAGSPVVPTPVSVRCQGLLKGNQRKREIDKGQTTGVPSTPPPAIIGRQPDFQRDVVFPTPQPVRGLLSSPIRAQALSTSPRKRRTSNAKLANRPQNRRRKSDMGQWFTPPKFHRSNTQRLSVDSSETPTPETPAPERPVPERTTAAAPVTINTIDEVNEGTAAMTTVQTPQNTQHVAGSNIGLGIDGVEDEKNEYSTKTPSTWSPHEETLAEASTIKNDELSEPVNDDLADTSAALVAPPKKATRIVIVRSLKSKEGPNNSRHVERSTSPKYIVPPGSGKGPMLFTATLEADVIGTQTKSDSFRSEVAAKRVTPTTPKRNNQARSMMLGSNSISPSKFVGPNHHSYKLKRKKEERLAREAENREIEKGTGTNLGAQGRNAEEHLDIIPPPDEAIGSNIAQIAPRSRRSSAFTKIAIMNPRRSQWILAACGPPGSLEGGDLGTESNSELASPVRSKYIGPNHRSFKLAEKKERKAQRASSGTHTVDSTSEVPAFAIPAKPNRRSDSTINTTDQPLHDMILGRAPLGAFISSGVSATAEKVQPKSRKRTVSEKELNDVLEPHPSWMDTNTSFGSFTQGTPPHRTARSSRTRTTEPQASKNTITNYMKSELKYSTAKLDVPTLASTKVPQANSSRGSKNSSSRRRSSTIRKSHTTPSRVPNNSPAPFFKPSHTCQDSVLAYAETGGWQGVSFDPVTGHVCRVTRAEREGVFRASGILMGARFVVGL